MDYIGDALDGFVVGILVEDVGDQDEGEMVKVGLGGFCGFDLLDPVFVTNSGSDVVACFQCIDEGAKSDEASCACEKDNFSGNGHYVIGINGMAVIARLVVR